MSRYPVRPVPSTKPSGLRLSLLRHPWYRLDTTEPATWSWSAFATPRYRFDSASGGFRVRYAAQTKLGAMRERFTEQGRIISASELALQLVELTGPVRVLDLRHERNLDALGLDDQINTARSPEVWAAAHQLSDLVRRWYGERCHALAYRSRTTPQSSANLAWFAHAPLRVRGLGTLGSQPALLATCVLSEGFTIEGWE